MSQAKRYYNWMIECAKIINENNIKENRRKLALAAVFYYLEGKKKRHCKKKRF